MLGMKRSRSARSKAPQRLKGRFDITREEYRETILESSRTLLRLGAKISRYTFPIPNTVAWTSFEDTWQQQLAFSQPIYATIILGAKACKQVMNDAYNDITVPYDA